jgi:hypothetical protein
MAALQATFLGELFQNGRSMMTGIFFLFYFRKLLGFWSRKSVFVGSRSAPGSYPDPGDPVHVSTAVRLVVEGHTGDVRVRHDLENDVLK